MPIEIILSVGFILNKFCSLYMKVHAINHLCNKLLYITQGKKKKKSEPRVRERLQVEPDLRCEGRSWG